METVNFFFFSPPTARDLVFYLSLAGHWILANRKRCMTYGHPGLSPSVSLFSEKWRMDAAGQNRRSSSDTAWGVMDLNLDRWEHQRGMDANAAVDEIFTRVD
ncbi:hypothetical protein CDAR_105931 [Caerostris darwini]|uniref:Uncharacterized protein n=1 Tax=Caerostris darwini TaxID=1538125 RepID=A0AAV4TRF6_9ARAC|nr:hypothetical protein CDAR_105931 [Caerostris darwini]